ncbi:MAG: CAP domain-containing protein [Sideroxyarcus sp.]|nr:CAP domain-containing protein [Sideroxyarcus sp.]
MKRLLLASYLVAALPLQAQDFDTSEMVAAHNRWRKNVGAPPLTYSAELANSAQAWANHLKQSNQCKMRHSDPDAKYGENLYWASAIEWSNGLREQQTVSPKTVVDSWASERADYNYKTNSCAKAKMCGHYTQVVWKSTRTVGCAVAVCEDSREQVWVCQYQPPGNWVGQKPY